MTEHFFREYIVSLLKTNIISTTNQHPVKLGMFRKHRRNWEFVLRRMEGGKEGVGIISTKKHLIENVKKILIR